MIAPEAEKRKVYLCLKSLRYIHDKEKGIEEKPKTLKMDLSSILFSMVIMNGNMWDADDKYLFELMKRCRVYFLSNNISIGSCN